LRSLSPNLLKELDVNTYNLFWYPAVYLGILLPAAADQWWDLFFGHKGSFMLYLHVIVCHSNGVLLLFLYGTSVKKKVAGSDDNEIDRRVSKTES